MGEEHEGGYASTSDEHRRQGDSVIRVITTVACPCQPIELSPVYLQSIAVSEALPIEIPVTDLRYSPGLHRPLAEAAPSTDEPSLGREKAALDISLLFNEEKSIIWR
ncbi:hypothetical protein F2Q68_00001121 [Brassica cretica]|nr:hypothetical protein F2Q68_00001121 [Brassica cretica]